MNAFTRHSSKNNTAILSITELLVDNASVPADTMNAFTRLSSKNSRIDPFGTWWTWWTWLKYRHQSNDECGLIRRFASADSKQNRYHYITMLRRRCRAAPQAPSAPYTPTPDSTWNTHWTEYSSDTSRACITCIRCMRCIATVVHVRIADAIIVNLVSTLFSSILYSS